MTPILGGLAEAKNDGDEPVYEKMCALGELRDAGTLWNLPSPAGDLSLIRRNSAKVPKSSKAGDCKSTS